MNNQKHLFGLGKDADGDLVLYGDFPQESEAERAERKSIGARCGHVKRRILAKEPLTGKVLEFALDVLGDESFASKGEISTAEKLKAGQPLNDYESHIMVDVLLLHTKLGAGQKIPQL